MLFGNSKTDAKADLKSNNWCSLLSGATGTVVGFTVNDEISKTSVLTVYRRQDIQLGGKQLLPESNISG